MELHMELCMGYIWSRTFGLTDRVQACEFPCIKMNRNYHISEVKNLSTAPYWDPCRAPSKGPTLLGALLGPLQGPILGPRPVVALLDPLQGSI